MASTYSAPKWLGRAVPALLAAVLAVPAAALLAPAPVVAPLAIGGTAPVDLPGLPNVVRLSEKLYSGAAPEGDTGFRTLRGLGIRTILTVDGTPPEVKTARRFGMRYVHLPFGYDGCPRPQANRIVRAVRDLPGPVYLHCHHGKHRAPTAAAFARIALDGLTSEQAVKEMERAGTGKNYTGLYGDIKAYTPPTPEELEAVKSDFPSVTATPPLTKAMVSVDQRWQGILTAQKDGWKDGKAPGGALQLRELFTEMNRTREVRGRAEDFRGWMSASEEDAKTLEAALASKDKEAADRAVSRIAAGCGTCHAKYRNVPQKPR